MATKKPPSPLEVITTADPSSLEWMNAFDQLSPQDQASIFNFGNVDTSPGGFDDNTALTDDGAGVDPGLQGTGYGIPDLLGGMNAPSMDPASQDLIQFGGGVNIPQYTAAGKLDPYDLGQEAARNNLYQDQITSLMDLGMAGLAGPGAIDPAAFAPVVTMPTERLKTPGMDLLHAYARGTGYRAFLAQKMLPQSEGGEGLTDDEALRDLWSQVNKPDDPNLSPQMRAAQQQLVNSLPANTFQNDQLQLPSGGSLQGRTQTPAKQSVEPYNTAAVVGFAGDLFQKSLEDQSSLSAGWQDPDTGNWYTQAPTQADSPATQEFHDVGLPTPVEQYTDPKYLQMAFNMIPDLGQTQDTRAQQTQAAESEFNAAQANAHQIGASSDALTQAWDEYQRGLGQERDQQSAAAGDLLRSDVSAYPEASSGSGAVGMDDFARMFLQGRVGALPENTQPSPPNRARTGPGINLGGRITGTSSDTYGRVRLNQPQAKQQEQPTGEGSKTMGRKPVQQPWVRALGNGLFQVGGTQDQANRGQTRGPVANPNAPVFDFSNPQSRPADTRARPINRQQVSQARTARQAADRRFVQANTQRFRNSIYTAPSDVQSLNSIWSAQSNRSTPYQDAIIQRLIAQRVAGLRGA